MQRIVPKTNNLRKICYPLALDKCDVVEETLLALAKIEEKPTTCHFYHWDTCDFFIFSLGISEAASIQFINFYKNFPDLNVKNMTQGYKSHPSDVKYTFVDGKPAQVFTMQYDALERHIFPLIDAYLKENPDKVTAYHRLCYPASQAMINGLFAEKKMSDQTDCFEESLVGIAQQHAGIVCNLLTLVNWVNCPLTVLDIICGYLHPCLSAPKEFSSDLEDDLTEIQSLIPRHSCYIDSEECPGYLEIQMLAEPKLSSSICSYFNNVINKTASVSPRELHVAGCTTPADVIYVEHRTLFDPIVIQDLKEGKYLKLFRDSFVSNLIEAKSHVEKYYADIGKQSIYSVALSDVEAAIDRLNQQNICEERILDNLRKAHITIERACEKVQKFIALITGVINYIQAQGLCNPGHLEKMCNSLKRSRAVYKQLVDSTGNNTKKRARGAYESRSSQSKANHLKAVFDLLDKDILKIESHIYAVKADQPGTEEHLKFSLGV